MNPHIGDMRRAREMKEFVHRRKLQLSGAKNREVIPELRSIPLTFIDCPDRKDIGYAIGPTVYGCYHFRDRISSCNATRTCNLCPRGFQ
jgi:hypothetical protein